MEEICYIERSTDKECVEKVYGEAALRLVYGEGWASWAFSKLFRSFLASCFSRVYGWVQKTSRSRKKVRPFIDAYGVDEREFLDPVESFGSFNDFFIRKLKPECRPIVSDKNRAILPADGRYLVYPDVSKAPGFFVKGQSFSLSSFLANPVLSRRFADASMVIARLCPTDYHRFHFPCDGEPTKPCLIQGSLFSVNPLALSKRLSILWENKRFLTELDSPEFGTVLYIEVGATAVGSVHQTYLPSSFVKKGDEKGYFSFGGSCIVLLFERGRIHFDEDLVNNSARFIETRANFGESLGVSAR
ncbi:MAG: archaetidylserine decarboxylase [Chlamydiales bacterium]|nr:archaetidylserine decarboxylase [Chlamydiales bacterium]